LHAPATRATPAPSAPPAEDELSMLRRAHAALRGGQPARALSIAGEHAKAHPRGVLSQEREVIAIEALQRLGRHAEARARGELFLRAFSKSSHARRVRTILGAQSGAPEPAPGAQAPSAAFPIADEKKSAPAHNPPAVSP
jgi:hypothetical protein